MWEPRRKGSVGEYFFILKFFSLVIEMILADPVVSPAPVASDESQEEGRVSEEWMHRVMSTPSLLFVSAGPLELLPGLNIVPVSCYLDIR